jgi:hypothetical protein
VQYAVAEAGLSDEVLGQDTQASGGGAATYSLRRTASVTESVQIDWYPSIANTPSVTAGLCLYTRIRDNYNDGTSSNWRFFAGTTPTYDLTLSADSLVV